MSDTRLYTVPAEGGLAEALPMPVSGGGTFSPDATKVALLPADPRFPHLESATRGAGAGPLHLRPCHLRRRASRPLARAPSATRCGSATRSTSHSDRTGTLNLFEFDSRHQGRQAAHDQHGPRRPLAEHGRTAAGSSTSWAASSSSWTRSRASRRRSRSPCPPTPWPGGRRGSRSREADRGLRPQPQGRAGAVRGPRATSSPRRSRKGRCGTSPGRPAPTTRPPAGRPTAAIRLHLRRDRRGGTLPGRPGRLGKPEQLTKGGKAMRYRPAWSPDGKRLAFSDKDGKVFVLTLADKSVVAGGRRRAGQVHDYAWSPVRHAPRIQPQRPERLAIGLPLERRPGKPRRVTSEMFNELRPGVGPRRELPLLS